MRQSLLLLTHLAGISLAVIAPAPVMAQASSLEGKTFEGVILEKGKTRGDADTLVFRNGKFRSSACDKYGFNEAPYKVSADGSLMRFEAVTESARDGKLEWTGYMSGNKLYATSVWVRSGKAPIEHLYVGSLRN
jgi:hypothetical protein